MFVANASRRGGAPHGSLTDERKSPRLPRHAHGATFDLLRHPPPAPVRPMRVQGSPYRTLWLEGTVVRMIDQTVLPFEFRIVDCPTHHDTALAVREMVVRGAPALGAAG